MKEKAERIKAEIIAYSGQKAWDFLFEQTEKRGGPGSFEWLIDVSDEFHALFGVPMESPELRIDVNEVLRMKMVLQAVNIKPDPKQVAFTILTLMIMRKAEEIMDALIIRGDKSPSTMSTNIMWN